MHIYGENMNKSSLVDGAKLTTRSPLTSRPIMDELAPAKNDTVPLTPEILNSVMAMTNPLEYSMAAMNNSKLQALDCLSNDSGSSFDSSVTSLGVSSEAVTPTAQQTCSELIKTSLKLSLEMKRKAIKCDRSPKIEHRTITKRAKRIEDSSDEEFISRTSRKTPFNLTTEDEDRRRRRRERNKIAATKCRMKKRERTINLISEAESLENQNNDLKAQVCNLEIERRSLTEMLQTHTTSCMHAEVFHLPVFDAPLSKSLNLNSAQQKSSHKQNNHKTYRPRVKTTPHRSSSSDGTQKANLQQAMRQKCAASKSQRHKPNAMPIANELNGLILGSSITASAMNPLPTIAVTLTTDVPDCKAVDSNKTNAYDMSTFLKAPVDLEATLPDMIENDYIPNGDSVVPTRDVFSTAGFEMPGDNNADGIEFMLKSELADTNDSPYTTVQSADRFLFDGVADAFGTDIDAATATMHTYATTHMNIGGFKESLHLHHANISLMNNHSNNNNTISNNMISNSNNNSGDHFPATMAHDVDGINNLTVISSVHSHPTNAPNDLNASCHNLLNEHLLLKNDFLNSSELLSTPTNDTCDSHFTTDLDSGLTTYTSMVNGNGCLA